MRIPTTVVVLSVWMALPGEGMQRDALPATDAIRSSTARFAVESAVRGAAHRLERPECAKVLSDFTVGRGGQSGSDSPFSANPPRAT
jgi:hypothetical protein